MIPPCLLKCLLDAKDYEHRECIELEKTLALVPDVVYCPTCETPCVEDEDQHALCPKCFISAFTPFAENEATLA